MNKEPDSEVQETLVCVGCEKLRKHTAKISLGAEGPVVVCGACCRNLVGKFVEEMLVLAGPPPTRVLVQGLLERWIKDKKGAGKLFMGLVSSLAKDKTGSTTGSTTNFGIRT